MDREQRSLRSAPEPASVALLPDGSLFPVTLLAIPAVVIGAVVVVAVGRTDVPIKANAHEVDSIDVANEAEGSFSRSSLRLPKIHLGVVLLIALELSGPHDSSADP